MNILLKALIALLIGAVVAYLAEKVCVHFGFDPFWGWLLGVIAGIAFFVKGNV